MVLRVFALGLAVLTISTSVAHAAPFKVLGGLDLNGYCAKLLADKQDIIQGLRAVFKNGQWSCTYMQTAGKVGIHSRQISMASACAATYGSRARAVRIGSGPNSWKCVSLK